MTPNGGPTQLMSMCVFLRNSDTSRWSLWVNGANIYILDLVIILVHLIQANPKHGRVWCGRKSIKFYRTTQKYTVNNLTTSSVGLICYSGNFINIDNQSINFRVINVR